MKIYKNENSLNGYAFEDDEGEEETEDVVHEERDTNEFVSDAEEVEQVLLSQEPAKPVKSPVDIVRIESIITAFSVERTAFS